MGFVLSLSFGVLAVQAGFTRVQAIVTAALVFAGSAQFAALAIIASGGTVLAAVAAAGLMNSRFLAMGIALAPSLPGGPVARGLQGQTVVDSSWALANQGDGSFDRWLLFGTTVPQYISWVAGTLGGVFLGEVRSPRARPIAALGALIALALGPVAPPGVPILAASVATLLALVRPQPGASRSGEAAS